MSKGKFIRRVCKFGVFLIIATPFLLSNAYADVTCEGKISNVYKWADQQLMSIQVNTPGGDTNWIRMPTKSDEAMALMAFAAGKTVVVRWGDGISYSQCINGWPHNTVLVGWWLVRGQ